MDRLPVADGAEDTRVTRAANLRLTHHHVMVGGIPAVNNYVFVPAHGVGASSGEYRLLLVGTEESRHPGYQSTPILSAA